VARRSGRFLLTRKTSTSDHTTREEKIFMRDGITTASIGTPMRG
jgi:hypothetical protein